MDKNSTLFRRFSSGNKTLWDETQINKVLGDNVIIHFPQNYQQLFDSVDEVLGVSGTHPKQNESMNILHNQVLDCCTHSTQRSVALLFCSWKIDSAELVNLLMCKGGDPNTTDPDGRSCLHLSCCAGHPNNVEALLRKRNGKSGHEYSGNDQRYFHFYIILALSNAKTFINF